MFPLVLHSYIEQVYLPMLKIGVQAEVRLNAWGWYPRVEEK